MRPNGDQEVYDPLDRDDVFDDVLSRLVLKTKRAWGHYYGTYIKPDKTRSIFLPAWIRTNDGKDDPLRKENK